MTDRTAGESAGDRLVRRYVVTGQVQGVGYRWFVREQARALDLMGIVRNATDGSVVVDVAGPATRITALEDALTVGPRGASVDGVNVTLDGEEAEAELQALPYPFAIAH